MKIAMAVAVAIFYYSKQEGLMKKKEIKKRAYSGIGGQAVLEGIMMRNKNEYAVAVRKPDGTIATEKKRTSSFAEKHKWAKLPIVRGCVSFVEALKTGMDTITWSASLSGEEEEEMSKGAMTGTILLAVLLAVGIFVVLPSFLASLLQKVISSRILISFLEGIIRLLIFIAYVVGVGFLKDIQRTYRYHGAEHKCINCIESGLPLTVENVMKSSKEHRRCGTSFLLIVMLLSILIFSFLPVSNVFLRILSRLLLLPVVAGLSFELLRFTGTADNAFTKIISRPGMWMQALTTKEPDESMAEVAIKATEAVFDWKNFLKENFGTEFPEEENNDNPAMDS